MSHLQVAFAVGAAIVLFVYGLQGFGRELRAVGGLPWLASWALAAMLLPTMPWVSPWLQRVLKVSDDARG